MTNNHVRYVIGLVATLFLIPALVTAGYWGEYLELFDSTITVNKDTSLDVVEKIIYVDRDYPNKHGIVREFPVSYKNALGSSVVDFVIKRVLKDGVPVDYHVENRANGKVIKIGNPSSTLSLGKHEYTLEYHTNRQLGFFKDSDELSWGVTGYGWRMPIKKVTAQVVLPSDIPAHDIGYELYTGFASSPKRDSNVFVDKNVVRFEPTGQLMPGQGVKLVVYWPKGFIIQPSTLTKIIWFLKDNLTVLWLLLGLFLTTLYALVGALSIRAKVRPGTVIPLFEPPAGLSPAGVRFIALHKYDHISFSAQIIDLAVHGFITIDYKKKIFSDVYTLTKKPEQPQHGTTGQMDLMRDLFAHTDTILLHKSYMSGIEASMQRDNDRITNALDYPTFDTNSSAVGKVLLMAGISIAPVLPFLQLSIVEIGLIAAFGLMSVLFYYAVQIYTLVGRKLADEIEGFKLFLQTTETERLKIIGTPPTKTPELYEKYLPYAVTLGVEEAWSKQFAPIFKTLTEQGHPYQPLWYSGSYAFDSLYFTRGFTSRMHVASATSLSSSTISSSSSAPGSSSGRGGGGSYGGGGGGGSW